MTPPAVAVRDLFRVYATREGEAAALQGLTLTVERGELVVVFGPSGSGKSTLLRILAALERPSAGTATAFGVDVATLRCRTRAAYRSRTLGYVDQHYMRSLAPELRARDLVSLQLRLLGTGTAAALARADELLDRVGLGDRGDAYPHELSGGEQQRVAVCAAVAHRPKLLLADEPTGELDEASAEDVYALLREIARSEGATGVIVSHDERSAAIADRIVGVRDGRISDEGAGATQTIVIGRGGWLRLPEELLAAAAIRARARARLVHGEIVVSSADAGGDATQAPPPVQEPEPPREGAVVAALASVSRTYGTGARATTPFRNVTAAFRGGRMDVVTGPSGAGKTTLLQLLAALDDPTEGEVTVAGTVLAALGRTERALFRRARVGIVGQHARLVPFLTARENVELGLALRGVREDEARQRADAMLAEVGLAERRDHVVDALSAGERQRVALARAIAPRPMLLLADEPTARLDLANSVAVAMLLSRLARETGSAVVCATHDPRVIEQADDEVVLGRRVREAERQ